MARLVSLLLLVFCLTATAGEHRWWKRVGAAAACAIAAEDGLSSFHAADIDPYGHETSGLLADSHGKPSAMKFSLIKGGMCAVAIVLSENKHVPALYSLTADGSMSVWSGTRIVHNLGIYDTRAIWAANHPK
jgi:hypothetical protein